MRKFLCSLLAIMPATTSTAAEDNDLQKFVAALNQLVESDSSVKIQKQNFETSESTANLSKYRYLPNVTAFGRHDRALGVDRSSNSYGVRTSWNLYRFGADKALAEKTEMISQVQKEQLIFGSLDAESRFADLLVDLIALDREIEIKQHFIKLRKDALEMAQKLYRSGFKPREDVDKLTIDLDNEVSSLSDLVTQKDSALAALRAQQSDLSVPKLSWPLEEYIGSDKFGKLLGEARVAKLDEQHPELRAKQLQAEQSRTGVVETRSAYLPSLDLRTDHGWVVYKDDVRKETFGSEPVWGSSASLELTVPLFDGLKSYSSYQESVDAQTTARLEVEKTAKTLAATREKIILELENAAQNILQRKRALGTAKNLFETALKGFQKGLISANDLRFEEERVLGGELRVIETTANAHKALVNLCHILGKKLQQCLI
jgi:outer membrane protein TolC